MDNRQQEHLLHEVHAVARSDVARQIKRNPRKPRRPGEVAQPHRRNLFLSRRQQRKRQRQQQPADAKVEQVIRVSRRKMRVRLHRKERTWLVSVHADTRAQRLGNALCARRRERQRVKSQRGSASFGLLGVLLAVDELPHAIAHCICLSAPTQHRMVHQADVGPESVRLGKQAGATVHGRSTTHVASVLALLRMVPNGQANRAKQPDFWHSRREQVADQHALLQSAQLLAAQRQSLQQQQHQANRLVGCSSHIHGEAITSPRSTPGLSSIRSWMFCCKS